MRIIFLTLLLLLKTSVTVNAYNEVYSNWTNTFDKVGIEDVSNDIVIAGASNGQILKYNGTIWALATDNTSAGGGSVEVSEDSALVVSATTVDFTTGIDVTNSGAIVTVSNDLATTTTPGIASFDSTQFTVGDFGGVTVTAIDRGLISDNLATSVDVLVAASHAAVTVNAPITLSGQDISITKADATTDGYIGGESMSSIDALVAVSHAAVTLAGTPDYITIANQVITRNAVDLAADITGTLPLGNGGLGFTSISDDAVLIGNSTANGFDRPAIPDCQDQGGNHLNYTAAVSVFTCGTSSSSGSGAGNAVLASEDGTFVQDNKVNDMTFNFTTGLTAASVASSNVVSVSGDMATTSAPGIASFDSTQFSVGPFGGVTVTGIDRSLISDNLATSVDALVAVSHLAVTVNAPLTLSGQDISITKADATTDGYIGASSMASIDALVAVSHAAVTLAGTPDYITIAGQTITRNAVDLAADVTGTLPVANGGTGATALTDLIALTTDTTGNYVQSVATTSPLTGGSGGSEGAALTLAIPAADASTNGYMPLESMASIDSLVAVSHVAVTITGEDYLSLSGQQITANAIDPDNLSASDFGDFTCNGTNCSLDADVVSNDEIAPQAVSSDQLQASNQPTDGQVYSYNATTLIGQWITPAGGGDITDVFDCATGDCNNVKMSAGDSLNAELGAIRLPSNTALTVDGGVTTRISRDALIIQMGSGATGGVGASIDVAYPAIQQKDFTLIEPDQINTVSKDVPVIAVDGYNYPNGIKITAIRLATSESSSARYNFEEWTQPLNPTISSIDLVAISASTETTETTLTDADVGVGSYVYVSIDSTNVNYAKGTIWYYAKD